MMQGASQVVLVVKNPPVNAGDVRDVGSIPGSGRVPGGGHGNPLQYSCLENLHGQRSLTGYSSWAHKESDAAEVTEHSTMARAYMAWLYPLSNLLHLIFREGLS